MDNSTYITTRDKIVSATLDLIKENGFQNVTVRKIANSAKVNIASINYYFGSKDAVIHEALKHVTDELMSCFNILDKKEMDGVLRLKQFLLDYSDVMNKYPDIIKNFISLVMNECDIQIPFKDFLKDIGFKAIKNTIQEIRPDEPEEFSIIRTIHLLSSTGYPILMGNHLVEMSSFDYTIQEQRYKYVDIILSNIIK